MAVTKIEWPPMVPRSEVRTLEMERDQAKARLLEMTSRPPTWLRAGLRESEYGDHVMRWWLFPPSYTRQQIEQELWRWDFDVSPRHCQHDYDCCGHFYTDGLAIEKRVAIGVYVTCSWYRNV